jgi:hypothetical protein
MVINSSVIEPETTTAVEPTTTTTAVTVPRKAAPVFRSAVATAPLGTTTTTEAPKIPLEVALKYLGQTGPWADGGFYCARAVSYFAEEAKVPGFIPRDGPSGLYADAVAEGRLTQIPTVDDIVFIDLFGPGGVGHGQVTHVAILEAIDGDVLTVIQGNGEPDPSVITRTTYKVSDGYVLAFAPFTKG